jgi:hypothetical protein
MNYEPARIVVIFRCSINHQLYNEFYRTAHQNAKKGSLTDHVRLCARGKLQWEEKLASRTNNKVLPYTRFAIERALFSAKTILIADSAMKECKSGFFL